MFGQNKKLNILLFFSLFCSLSFEIKAIEDGDYYSILACTRNINKVKSPQCAEHCYVIFTKKDELLDSRGYFADVGSVQEKGIFSDGYRKCITVKKQKESLSDEWSKITEIYDKCRAEDYKIASHNCCTVAYEAIKGIIGNNVPQNITDANSSIGTKCRF